MVKLCILLMIQELALVVVLKTKEAGIEIQPRYKIQYPMKNRNKDVFNN